MPYPGGVFSGKTIFSQVVELIHPQQFRRCVVRYRGDYKVKAFSCWDQFLCMAFAQLTFRESLRDIEDCLKRALRSTLPPGLPQPCVSQYTWPMPTKCATGASTRIWRRF